MLATVSDVEILFQTTFDAGPETAAIELALQAADAAVKGYVGTDLEQTARTDELHHVLQPAQNSVWTDHWPVSNVVVSIWNGTVYEALTEYEEYVVGQPEFGRLDRTVGRYARRSWSGGYDVVSIDYTSGYATTPKDIVDVVATLANRIYEEAQAGVSTAGSSSSGVVEQETIGEYSVRYSTGTAAVQAAQARTAGRVGALTTAEQALLDRYRRPVLT